MAKSLTPTEFYSKAEKAVREVKPEIDKTILDYISKTYCPHDIYIKDPIAAWAFTKEHCNYLTDTYKEKACQICWDKFITEVLSE